MLLMIITAVFVTIGNKAYSEVSAGWLKKDKNLYNRNSYLPDRARLSGSDLHVAIQ